LQIRSRICRNRIDNFNLFAQNQLGQYIIFNFRVSKKRKYDIPDRFIISYQIN